MVETKDLYGSVVIPDGVLWGVNTQRSLLNFPIGVERMPKEFIETFIQLKQAIAYVNIDKGVLNKLVGKSIVDACEDLLSSDYEVHFPLSIWQTGSGTQTNMNVNEVIAKIASKKLGKQVHPNDDVNRGQSSNDVFPTAMHITLIKMLKEGLIPAIKLLKTTLGELSQKYKETLKTGRTHLQDATPITFGQEVSAWQAMYSESLSQLEATLPYLRKLAIGGTAVGTGLNTFQSFGEDVCQQLNNMLNEEFVSSANKFHSLSSKDAIVFLHGALNSLAGNSMKVANDIRWLASGPRCGLGEINLPSNEAGSSIMPGKVNPTQAEALTMVCVQVMANNQAVAIGSSQGNFQLNVFMPMILHNVWQSIRLLTDSLNSFRIRCLQGISVNQDVMRDNLEKSLMTATYLNHKFGYDRTGQIVKKAHNEDKNIKEIVLEEKLMTAEEFDEFFKYEEMVKPYI